MANQKFNMAGVAEGAVSGAVGQVMNLAFGGIQDKRQLKQQAKLNALQIKGNKEMADYQNEKAMQMWHDTNYNAQVEEMKKAGLSPGAILSGGGGTSGTTGGASAGGVSGGNAGDPNAGVSNGMAMAAQIALMTAQKDKLKAETENLQSGTGKDVAQTGKIVEETKEQKFNNAVNDAITAKGKADKYEAEKEQQEIKAEEMNADWENKKAIEYRNNYIDADSPKSKAVIAKLKLATEDLRQKKLENDIKGAELTVKKFEAGLAEQGISPNSPWGVKLIADLLESIGITGTVKKLIKK